MSIFQLPRIALMFSGITLCVACSTGSSMQIDVEVYKGPLSKTTEVQCAELRANIAGTVGPLEDMLDRITAFTPRGEDTNIDSRKPPAVVTFEEARISRSGAIRTRVERAPNQSNRYRRNRRENLCGVDCAFRAALLNDLNWAKGEAKTQIESNVEDEKFNTKKCRDAADNSASSSTDTLTNAAKYGAELRQRAEAVSASQTGLPISDPGIRLLANRFSVFAAEAGNQIVARVDALLLQRRMRATLYNKLGTTGPPPKHVGLITPAQRLATSIYLRDSNATAYQNLYDWNRNTSRGRKVGEMSELDRIRTAEELMRDTYWSKINTVHANGVGEVRMAFIKDDIGNWNLKSFSADPEELLNAYSDLTRSIVGEAATAITTGGGSAATKVGGAEKFLGFASKAAIGETENEATLNASKLSDLRMRIKERVEQVHATLKTERGKKQEDVTKAESALAAVQEKRKPIERDIKCLDDQLKLGGLETQPACKGENDAPLAVVVPPSNENTGEVDDNSLKVGTPEILQARRAQKVVLLEQNDAEIQKSTEVITAAKAEVTKVEKLAMERARLVLRDHAAVVSALQEVLAPVQAEE